ncbi:MAG: AbrB/MazE/SpoVT family DNA-binding domain-containing protein [Lactobacillales bacterium]|jgi:AbrB family looped-hinge helix DNA binding protein|nr:AbrB/MazE/SpoVT family DNA-binding domain-containing protein [Lactobacillales bacterium]
MIAELRAKSQITLPKAIVKKLGLETGDQLEFVEKNGVIYMVPVVTYPKAFMDHLDSIVADYDEEYKLGKTKSFDSVAEMIKALEEENGL